MINMTAHHSYDVVVVGAGIFGVTSALELKQRGYQVALLDPGPLPNPLASSTDISKVVRVEYASDEEYAQMAQRSRAGFLQWNEWFEETLYHDIGVIMIRRTSMSPGDYEYENYHSLLRRGFSVDRLDSKQIETRFPAFNPRLYVDGYYHSDAGYVESGVVVSALLAKAEQAGVAVLAGHTVQEIQTASGRVSGVKTAGDEGFAAQHVVITAGAMTPYLVPDLQPYMRSVGMPVFHLKPQDPMLFEVPKLAVFSADVTESGWYGFPLHPKESVVKIAHHGQGIPVHPITDERVVTEYETTQLRKFLAESIPPLVDAPIVYTRRCLYCDTLDEHFWIDRHPETEGLVVAAGGSGHAYKFGPLLGGWVADAIEGKPNPESNKFRWRDLPPDTPGEEASRFRDKL